MPPPFKNDHRGGFPNPIPGVCFSTVSRFPLQKNRILVNISHGSDKAGWIPGWPPIQNLIRYFLQIEEDSAAPEMARLDMLVDVVFDRNVGTL